MEERMSHFERPTTKRPPSLMNLVILTALIGVLAGFGGAFLVKLVLGTDSSNYFNLINSSEELKINIEQPLTNMANKHQKSVAGVYRPVTTLSAVGEPLFASSDFLGSAVVVTSDGWLMTTNQVAKNNQAKVVLGDNVYDIDEIKTDEFTGAVFIKIEESLLQPVNFQLTDDINVGERLFTNIDLPNSLTHSFQIGLLDNNHYVLGKYLSADELDYYFHATDLSDVATNSLSAPYFNLEGDLIGLTYNLQEGTVLLPAEYLRQAVKNLLNGTERVSLGIRYIDMENNSGFVRKGNLVYSPQANAVEYNSPAYVAGLLAGDQIVAVNNDIISSARTLTSIIQNYRPGDQVIIKILRDGVEQDIEVSL